MTHRLMPRFIYDQYRTGHDGGRLEAAALFMDISGFTAMSQALMKHGKVGAELLSTILNDIFEPVICTIYEHGGFVTGFAGDAFTALFPTGEGESNEENSLRRPVLQALYAAQRISQILVEEGLQRTPLGDFPLAVKMGLSAGVVEWGILGTSQHKTWFFRGPAIRACTRAEARATAGQILLDNRVQALLPPGQPPFAQAGGEPVLLPAGWRPDGFSASARRFPTRQDEDYDPRIAARFFPPEILERPLAGEFRDTTIVFMSFEAEVSLYPLARFVDRVILLADRFGGFLSGIDFGDKGGTVLVYFGAPVAYENNIHRAINFSLALKSQLAQARIQLSWRAGITSGAMFVGLLGNRLRSEFTALGPAVNLAARLMTQAEWGQILVSESVVEVTGFHFAFLGEHLYKGLAQPVPTYQLIGEKSAEETVFERPMIGREAELATLLEAAGPLLDHFGSGDQKAGAAIIYGEPGSGKSRLAFALRQKLPQDVSWFSAQCDTILRQPLNPFQHFLRGYFRQTPGAAAVENKAAFDLRLRELIGRLETAGVAKTLADELIRVRSVLGALLGLYWPNSLYESLDAAARYQNTLFAIKTLLLAESQLQPVVIELDDAYWLDDTSRELLLTLSRNIGGYRLFLLITCRLADDGHRPSFALASDLPLTVLELGGLPERALRELATKVLGGPIDESLFSLLSMKSQANPFFAQQFLDYFQENHLLVRNDNGQGRWQIRNLDISLPSSINAILIARIDRLPQEVKAVVQVASVLGQEFAIEILLQMVSYDANPVIRMAEQEQIWTAVDETRYLFQHGLLREAAYHMQFKARLDHLHHQACEAYETVFAGELSPYYADLAYHAGQAGDRSRERRYAELAGQRAAAQFANAEAAGYFSRALSLTPAEDLASRLALLLEREQMFDLLGDRQAQAQDLESLERLLDELAAEPVTPAAELQARVTLRRARLQRMISDYQPALQSAKEAIALAQRANSPELEAEGHLALGDAFIALGDYESCQQHYETALLIGREAGLEEVEASSLHGLGSLVNNQGNTTQALDYYEQALGIYRLSENQAGQAAMFNSLGNILIHQGDLVQAESYYAQSLALHHQTGNRRGESLMLNNLGNLFQAQGRLDQARRNYEKSLEIKREIGDRRGEGHLQNNLGNHFRSLGRLEAAGRHLRQALAIQQELGNRPAQCMVNLNLAQVSLLEGEYGKASQCFSETLHELEEIGNRMLQGYAWTGLGDALSGLSQPQAAEDAYLEALRLRQEMGQLNLIMETRAGLAELYLAHGRTPEALGQVNEIMDHLTSHHSLELSEEPFRIFLTCYQVLHAADDRRAGELLATAIGLLETQAGRIEEPADRESFLKNIPVHHRLVALATERGLAIHQPGTGLLSDLKTG